MASWALNAHDLGAIVSPVGGEWWRYFAAPPVYPDVGHLFHRLGGDRDLRRADLVEQRLGTILTVVLIVASGALGMLAADGIETAFAGTNDIIFAAGGNGIALGLLGAWAVMRTVEVRADPSEDVEWIGAGVAAAVLILLPLVDDYASVFAGLARPGRRRQGWPPFWLGGSANPADVGQGQVHLDHARALHRYSVDHSSFRTGWSSRSSRRARHMGDLALMQIAGDQAAFTTIVVRAIVARRALEVGTFLGYGAIAIARGLPDDGELILSSRRGVRRAGPRARAQGGASTEGRDPGRARFGEPAGDGPHRAVRLRLHRRDKTEYIDDFEEVLARLRSNGVIMIDNTLREGTVLIPGSSPPALPPSSTTGWRRTSGVDVVLLGLADGITMARKR